MSIEVGYAYARWTAEELNTALEDTDKDSILILERWIDRGDGVAIYQNKNLGSPDGGHRKYVSYGSPAAQLEVETHLDLPPRLPDMGGQINWAYMLEAVYFTKAEAEEADAAAKDTE